jgi:multidrug efflux pump subunit AcrB
MCICIVFVPMFFLTGVAGFLFAPLAKAVVFAVLASYVLSRTLVPTLVMWFERSVHHGHGTPGFSGPSCRTVPVGAAIGSFQQGFERAFDRFPPTLSRLLGWYWPSLAFGAVFLAFCAASLLLVPFLGQDFFPSVDAGIFRLHVRAHTGTRIEESAVLVDPSKTRFAAKFRRGTPGHH